MPFQGFSEQTNQYFFGAELENTRAYFERNREVYQTYVKKPLLALHEELVATAKEIDEDIVVSPNRCTSKAFNDFRYTGKVTPVKTYMYLHFFSPAENKAYDTPGVFFDAGSFGYRIGFGSYDMTPPAMAAVRRAILERKPEFLKLERRRVRDGFELRGADYRRDLLSGRAGGAENLAQQAQLLSGPRVRARRGVFQPRPGGRAARCVSALQAHILVYERGAAGRGGRTSARVRAAMTVRADINGVQLALRTDPSLFSPAHLDRGTAAMLRYADFRPGDCVLDLGCGYGAVGVYAAKIVGAENVVMCDISETAAALAAENAAANGVPGVAALCGDGYDALPAGQTFTCILSNPPYHADFSVAKRFIEGGYARLRTGGRMLMVTKRADWYRNKLKAVFGGVRVYEQDGYCVFCAEKRAPRRRPEKTGPALSKKLRRKYGKT